MSGPPNQSPWGSGWPFPMSTARRRAYSALPPPRAFRSPSAENANTSDDDDGVKLEPFPAPPPPSSSSFSSHFHSSLSAAAAPPSLQPPVGIERTALSLRTANAGAAAVNRLREAAGVSRGSHGRTDAHKRGFSVAAESFRPLGLGSSAMDVPEPAGKILACATRRPPWSHNEVFSLIQKVETDSSCRTVTPPRFPPHEPRQRQRIRSPSPLHQ